MSWNQLTQDHFNNGRTYCRGGGCPHDTHEQGTSLLHTYQHYSTTCSLFSFLLRDKRRVFQDLPEPTSPTVPCPLLSLYGVIYVTWYTSGIPKATGVRLRLPNNHTLLNAGSLEKHP